MTLDDLKKEMEPLMNHICVMYDTEMARLVGVAEDEMDMYYIVRPMNPKKEYRGTAVGHIVSLKDSYERYEHMDNVFAMNGSEKVTEFKVINDRNI